MEHFMTDTQSKPVILIDGSSYLFRAYHALPPLTNTKGQPTGAVYGVTNMIRKLLSDYEPDRMAVIFDSKVKTFRHLLYQEYKANRESMPDELQVQIQPLHDLIKAMGIPLIVVDGVEADDVIGTLASEAKHHGYDVLISTGDKDMAQLVNGQVTLINTMTNTLLDHDGVVKKFGIRPDQMIDYLTLVGDSSDNIPGVPSVGPKTAQKWLTQYEHLDAIIKDADNITGKVGDNFREAISQIPLSKQLVTIKCDVPLPVKLKDLNLTQPNFDLLQELYQQLEFKALLSKLENKSPSKATNYKTILTSAQLSAWIKKLENAPIIAFDTETNSLNDIVAELVGISMATDQGVAVYIPLAHDYPHAPDQMDRQTVLEALVPILSDEKKIILGQNIKYDLNVLGNYSYTITAPLYDTMLESYVLSGGTGRHDMDSLALNYLGKSTITFEEVAGKGKKQITFNKVEIDKATKYAAEDADITFQLHRILWSKLSKIPAVVKVFQEIEMPLVKVLMRMERYGVLIDPKMLRARSEALEKRIMHLESEAHQLAGNHFNLSSPKQLQDILFNKMQLPVISKTPKGQPSTSEAVLQELAMTYPLPNIILEHRSLSKLKSTYTDKLPEQINPKTGRIHTSYNQAVTSTGRLSSTDPNLQNIPIRTEEGRKIRQAFIAPKGYKIVSGDYSQIELRIMAHLTGDPGLVRAFRHGLDVHKATASEIFNVGLEEVTSEQRRQAKAINFGLIYGMSPYGLSRQINVDREEAQRYMETYFHRYPLVKQYMDNIRTVAREQGYVETIKGRRLYMPDINSKNFIARNAAERAAINAPMQGTAAEIIKIAMINIDQWLEENQIEAKMIMQVHDELVFEVATPMVEKFIKVAKELMETSISLNVPIEVSFGVGENWDEAH
jgi:DNA polymerase-1